MRAAGKSNRIDGRRRDARTLGIVALVALLFGIVGMGEFGEDSLRTSRNLLNPVNASGDIVLVEVDETSQKALGAWPWKRAVQAQLIERLDKAGAKQIAVDFTVDYPTDAADDSALADALARSGKVILPVQDRFGDGDGAAVFKGPLKPFAASARLGTISVYHNYQMAVWRMSYGSRAAGQSYPSFASLLSGVRGDPGATFPIDYRYRISSIPRLSASDVLRGTARLDTLRGKSVIVGLTAPTIGDQYALPGRGRYGGVYTHIYAAETLKGGKPLDLGWLPGLAAMLLLSWAVMQAKAMRVRATLIALGVVALLGAPMLSEPRHIFIDVTPGLFALLSTCFVLGRRRYRERGFTNAATGMPNLNALKARRQTKDRALIVARVINYAQLAATLNDVGERKLVEQITVRLGVGTHETPIYQGDEGIFAWLAEPGIAVGHHVEALHALFRNPARIGSRSYDLAVSFGVEIGSGRSIANRLSSALVAADEAAAEGLKWKYHDPERFKDESWRLSLLAQLDQAIDSGEVWVAFQPQLDLATNSLRGAEALARWTHPEKGPISPTEFITAAEQHGRIDRLTLFMLDKAIAAAARINRGGTRFNISVNLSARSLSRRTLPGEVRDLLEEHRLDPALLTLELTETAALANDGSDLDPLIRLRDLGIAISIDDYGTGLSTLDYLKKVPASEIKIDQSFIKSMSDNRSDLVMVKSTIALAHSLGRTVVAEGVEDRQTLETLAGMKCDAAQGYLIGRPTSFEGLMRRLNLHAKGRAA